MPIGDLLASITGEPSPTTTSFPVPRRKADNDLRKPAEKLQTTSAQAANSSRPINPSSKPAAVVTKPKVDQNGRAVTQDSATSTFKNGQPTPPPTNDPPKALKKGSFAEIMARGKAAQTTLGQIGKIQHKKIEKLPSKREREAMQAQKGKHIQKALDSKRTFTGAVPAHTSDGKSSVRGNGKAGQGKTMVEPERKVKKAAAATTGYAGTARPKPGASKPASRASATASSSRDRDRLKDRGPRYAYASEDEEDEEMEEDLVSALAGGKKGSF